MELSKAIDDYVTRKRLLGRRYVNESKELRAFSRMNPDTRLAEITRDHVSCFLNYRPLGRQTWAGRYARLKAFFAYWLSRQQIDRLPMPRPRRAGQRMFCAHVYSRSEIRTILKKAPEIQNRVLSSLRPETFRMLVVLLYATGMWVGEALSVRLGNLDLENSIISLSSRTGATRRIPIGSDLTRLLKRYIAASQTRDFLIATKQGGRVSAHRAAIHFRRVRRLVGISRTGGGSFQPGLRDLRHSFAVHRISDWHRRQANLELMLPRLAAYMGLRDSTSADRYLPLTPAHFRQQLDDLSKGI